MCNLFDTTLFILSLSVCKKEECVLQAPPTCPAYRQVSVKKTKCCDVFECACSCHNSTRTCPAGFITSTSTNECGCTETNCLPDKVILCLNTAKVSTAQCFYILCCNVFLQVCVVGGTVHPVGSEWEEGCEKCTCTQLQDKDTSLHVAQCIPPACDRNCPLVRYTHIKHASLHLFNLIVLLYVYYTIQGSAYSRSEGKCCGKCTPTSCVESAGEMRGDTLIGAKLRDVCGKIYNYYLNTFLVCMRVYIFPLIVDFYS